jgi:hypothetical protein
MTGRIVGQESVVKQARQKLGRLGALRQLLGSIGTDESRDEQCHIEIAGDNLDERE